MTGDEGSDDVLLKLFGVIKNVMVDPQNLCHATRVINVSNGAATRVRRSAPQLERGAHDLMTLLEQESCGHRRINATAHRYENFHPSSLPVVRLRLSA